MEAAGWLGSIAGRTAIVPSAWDGLVAERGGEAAIESLRLRRPAEVTTLEMADFYRSSAD